MAKYQPIQAVSVADATATPFAVGSAELVRVRCLESSGAPLKMRAPGGGDVWLSIAEGSDSGLIPWQDSTIELAGDGGTATGQLESWRP